MAIYDQPYPQPTKEQVVQQAKKRGLELAQQGRIDDAQIEFQKAVQLQPDDPDAHHNLGVLLIHQQRFAEAALRYQQFLLLKPNDADAHYGMGVCLHQQCKRQEATQCYHRALALQPDHVKALNNMGVALMELSRLSEAATYYQRALRVKPDHVDAEVNLGIVLMKLGRLEESAASYRRALAWSPNLVDALSGLGAVLTLQGQLSEALVCFEKALQLSPQHAESHLNRAVILLLRGQWQEGWPEYEWRWRTKTFAAHAMRQPRWDGSPLGGRTILLQAEQGLGDTLHFIRYVPLVKERGGRVIVQCEPPLMRLLTAFQGIDILVSRGAALPPCDVHAPLGSLPAIFHTSPENVPAPIPYLHADSALIEKWRAASAAWRDNGKGATGQAPLLVGLAWQGSPGNAADIFRSMALARLIPLAKVQGVQFLSLQKGPGTDQIAAVGAKLRMIELGSGLDEVAGPFMDTAAVMKNLDLVISCDTAIAHLAGGLGVPVWVALSLAPDWRWLLQGSETAWYPTMRLYRQSRLGNWDEVFERMAAELQALVSRRQAK